jgi:hypothetical protein
VLDAADRGEKERAGLLASLIAAQQEVARLSAELERKGGGEGGAGAGAAELKAAMEKAGERLATEAERGREKAKAEAREGSRWQHDMLMKVAKVRRSHSRGMNTRGQHNRGSMSSEGSSWRAAQHNTKRTVRWTTAIACSRGRSGGGHLPASERSGRIGSMRAMRANRVLLEPRLPPTAPPQKDTPSLHSLRSCPADAALANPIRTRSTP